MKKNIFSQLIAKIDRIFEQSGNFLASVKPLYKLIAFGSIILLSCIIGTLFGIPYNEIAVLAYFMFASIPLAIIHSIRLKNKYDVKLLSLPNPLLMIITGILILMPSFLKDVFCIDYFQWIFEETSLFISLPLHGLFILLSYLIFSKSLKSTMTKMGFPAFEIQLSIMILYFLSSWIGVLIIWALLIAITLIILRFALAALGGGFSGGSGGIIQPTTTWTEGYDEFGEKVYDSRND